MVTCFIYPGDVTHPGSKLIELHTHWLERDSSFLEPSGSTFFILATCYCVSCIYNYYYVVFLQFYDSLQINQYIYSISSPTYFHIMKNIHHVRRMLSALAGSFPFQLRHFPPVKFAYDQSENQGNVAVIFSLSGYTIYSAVYVTMCLGMSSNTSEGARKWRRPISSDIFLKSFRHNLDTPFIYDHINTYGKGELAEGGVVENLDRLSIF